MITQILILLVCLAYPIYGVRQLRVNMTFDYLLSDYQYEKMNNRSTSNIDVVFYDGQYAEKALIDNQQREGKIVVCYFSAGTIEDWRIDFGALNKSVMGAVSRTYTADDGTIGTGYYLDYSQLDMMKPFYENRVAMAVDKGCDGIDWANTNIYTFPDKTKLRLSEGDGRRLIEYLIDITHASKLLAGINNNAHLVETVPHLSDLADFLVCTDCTVIGTCEMYEPFVLKSKPVFAIEYFDTRAYMSPESKCSELNFYPFSGIIVDRNYEDVAYFYSCLHPPPRSTSSSMSLATNATSTAVVSPLSHSKGDTSNITVSTSSAPLHAQTSKASTNITISESPEATQEVSLSLSVSESSVTMSVEPTSVMEPSPSPIPSPPPGPFRPTRDMAFDFRVIEEKPYLPLANAPEFTVIDGLGNLQVEPGTNALCYFNAGGLDDIHAGLKDITSLLRSLQKPDYGVPASNDLMRPMKILPVYSSKAHDKAFSVVYYPALVEKAVLRGCKGIVWDHIVTLERGQEEGNLGADDSRAAEVVFMKTLYALTKARNLLFGVMNAERALPALSLDGSITPDYIFYYGNAQLASASADFKSAGVPVFGVDTTSESGTKDPDQICMSYVLGGIHTELLTTKKPSIMCQ